MNIEDYGVKYNLKPFFFFLSGTITYNLIQFFMFL